MKVKEAEYLAHYGILGMKWGRRKAVRNTASVKSAKATAKAANKQYSRDYDKAHNTSANLLNKVTKKGRAKEDAAWKKANASAKKSNSANKALRLERQKAMEVELNKKYPGNSKALNKRLAKTSTGKALAQSFLLGSYGALKYNEYKSKGWSTGKSAVNAVLRNYGNNLTLGTMARKDKKRALSKR